MTEEPPALDPRVQAALERLAIPHAVLACDPAAADTAAFCARYGIPLERSLNTIVVASKKEPRQFVACLVQASGRLDVNKRVRELMGVSRVSFAASEDTTRLTGMLVGGVTAFGLPADWPVYADEAVLGLDWVILGGGNRASKLRVDPKDLRLLPGLQFVTNLTLPLPADPVA